MYIGYWWERQEERDHQEYIDVSERKILEYISEG
jgi:hypothetical protein